MKNFSIMMVLCLAFTFFFSFNAPIAAQSPGTLANPGFENQPMKSVYFFAGDWRGPAPGQPFYDGLTPTTNECLYTVHPLDPRHLGWSESPDNRVFAVNAMLAAGVNVVNMSYWGPSGDNTWAFWAPMQTAIGAHNELFDVAVGRPLLIIPTIEEGDANYGQQQSSFCGNPLDLPLVGPVGNSDGYHFANEFPGTQQNPAPGLVFRIEDLINRYLKGGNSDWAGKWAQLYDKDGMPCYVVSIIHVGSNQTTSDSDFAAGFDWVAEKVWQDTGGLNGGIRVGFTLDLLPGVVKFFADPVRTGPELRKHPSVLAVQAFIPELFSGICNVKLNPGSKCDQLTGSNALNDLINNKQQYIQGWVGSGIPVILDVAPGYDGIGPDADNVYGNNDPWRNAQSGFLSLGVVGLVGNSWNGFTEGYALMPACGLPPGLLCSPHSIYPEDVNYTWFRNLVPPGGSPARQPTAITNVAPGSGVYSDATTLTAELTEALTGSPISGRTVQFKVGSQTTATATDANGVATATITVNQQPATVDRFVSFAGDSDYLSFSVKDSFVITRERAVLYYTGTQAIANGSTATLSALLTDDDAQPVSGRIVGFTLGSGGIAQSCTGVTDSAGNAGCQLIISQVLGPQTISVTFAGDSYYEPASSTASVVLFAYLPAGSFVIADRSALTGANVLFWGDIWSKVNQPSGGPAPASFKGFEKMPATPPACGGNWSTNPGNSSGPPSSIPSYMAVIVSSAITKHGSMISGNTQELVVVKTNPGYAPDPGHAGTGKVIAVICP